MYKLVNGKERIFYLDFTRSIAIILVILAHVSREFFKNTGGNYKILCVPFMDFAILGVPLFLMISGTLLLNRDYELVSFLKKKIC